MEIAGFGVEEWLNTWEKSAQYDISQSTIASMTMKELLALNPTEGAKFYDDLNPEKMNYGWIEGSPEFKTEVAKLYDDMPAENILQTNGATGANHLALYALIEPGDHVISEYPSYQQLYDIPKSLGATVDFWHIHEENDWNPDIEELKQLIQPNTKMICLNNANNPTGTILDRDMLRAVVELAKTVGAYVLVDEVYLPLDDPESFTSIVDLYDKGIATNSLSKTYSTPGIRVGWTASNAQVADIFRKYRDYTMICAGVFSDKLAVYVLRNRDKVMARNRALVLNNLEIVKDWVAHEDRVDWVQPRAVSTSFIKLEIPPEKTEDFFIELLQQEGVLLVPGNRFDVPGHARLGYCAPEATLREGLKRLSSFLATYPTA